MITINLLPVELRPIKRTPLPYFIVLTFATLVGALCAFTFIKDIAESSAAMKVLYQNQAELDTHKENIDKYKALIQKQKHFATKLTTINEIASDRLIWSFHLDTLARLAPPNLWYESIEESTRTITNTIRVTDPKTGKLVNKRVKKVIPVLKLKGAVSADDLGRTDITPFLALLEDDEVFTSMFQMEPPTLNFKKVDEDNVRTFVMDCVIAPRTRTGETE